MVIEIPNRLKNPKFRFVFLGRWNQYRKGNDTHTIREFEPQTKEEFEKIKDDGWNCLGKSPIEPGWNKQVNYVYADPRLINHLQQDKNYGLVCKNGLVILDWDDIPTTSEVETIIPETFTVRTGGNKRHYYFLVPTGTTKIVFTKNKIHLGELQSTGFQCVGPGSFHPIGKKVYEVIKDIEIAELPQTAINKLKELNTDSINEESIKVVNWERYNKSSIDFSIASLTPKLGNLKTRGNEMFGSHPVHGSETGMNFHVNTSKSFWHCFRCNSGGDALALLSLLERVCDCKDFSPEGKKLRGEDFKKVLDIAKRDYGINIENKNPAELEKQHQEMYKNQEELKIITERELENLPEEKSKWIVKEILAEQSIAMYAGKTRTKKSLMATNLALSCCSGKKFLNTFETDKCKCLYLDEENPKNLTRERAVILRKGLKIEPTDDLGYVIHSSLKIDSPKGINRLIELINKFKPKLIILDSLIRFLSKGTDENSSVQMSNILDDLRKLTTDYNVSFLIVHHMNKGRESNDEADTIRGSTDIINAMDFGYLFSLVGDKVRINQTKNRYKLELPPFTVSTIAENDANGDTISLNFAITQTAVEDMDIESRAAIELYGYFSRDEAYDSDEKIFKTEEAAAKLLNPRFTRSENKAKILTNKALNKLINEGKVERVRRGYYKILDLNEERISTLSDFGNTEEPEFETEN